MNKDELKLNIENMPMFSLQPVNMEKDNSNIAQPQFKAVCEEGENNAIAVVSDRYNLVQFKSVFLPVVNGIKGDLQGKLFSFNGTAVMDIFPTDAQYMNNNYQYGITVKNSVDRTSSLVIRFSVMKNGFRITLPRTLQGFKKSHSQSNLLHFAQMYSGVLTRVQKEWEMIVTGFSERQIDNEQELLDICTDKAFGFSDKMRKKLVMIFRTYKAQNLPYTLWAFFEDSIALVSSVNHKSEVHKRNHTDALVEKILQYGFLTKFMKTL